MSNNLNHINIGDRAVTPSKIVCIGRNYVGHITELGNEIPDQMVVFAKPNSAISDRLFALHQQAELHYEGELCFVFEEGEVTAVGFGLDLTKRALQSKLKSKGLPWERAKAFDGAAVLSHFVPISGDLSGLSFALSINGARVQSGSIDLMMYPPQVIQAELANFMRLANGDVVMTGTPAGVGVIHAGEVFSASVSNHGETLLNAEWTAE